jgi:hypothetical protein
LRIVFSFFLEEEMLTNTQSMVLALAVVGLGMPAISGAAVIYTNSFETPTLSSGGQSFGPYAGWSTTATGTGGNPNTNQNVAFPSSPPAGITGNQLFRVYHDNNTGGGVSPSSSATSTTHITSFAANTVYTLTASLSKYDGDAGGFNFGIGIGTAANSGSAANTAATVVSTVIPNGTLTSAFADYSVVVNTQTNPSLVGQSLRIQFLVNSSFSFGRSAAYDNVRLDASPIPEPASVGMIAAVAAGLLLRRR